MQLDEQEKVTCDLCRNEAVYIIDEIDGEKEITRRLCEDCVLKETDGQKRNTPN